MPMLHSAKALRMEEKQNACMKSTCCILYAFRTSIDGGAFLIIVWFTQATKENEQGGGVGWIVFPVRGHSVN